MILRLLPVVEMMLRLLPVVETMRLLPLEESLFEDSFSHDSNDENHDAAKEEDEGGEDAAQPWM